MTAKYLVMIGGVFHFGMVLLHVMFPKILHWKTELELFAPINKVVYQILSKLLMYTYAIICFGSFYFRSELIDSRAGNFILLAIGIFWAIRAFLQVKYFQVFDQALGARGQNLAMLFLWIFASALYLIAVALVA